MEKGRFTHRDRQRLERAAEHYLRDCYRRSTAARVQEFAAFLGVSQAYLSRRVMAMTGMWPSDFLRSRQLTYSAELLRTTPLSVREVGLASAFGTAGTFHRAFREAYGTSPGKYRKQVMK